MRWEDNHTPGGLHEGLAGGWGGVILLMGTQALFETLYRDEYNREVRVGNCTMRVLLEGLAGGWGCPPHIGNTRVVGAEHTGVNTSMPLPRSTLNGS